MVILYELLKRYWHGFSPLWFVFASNCSFVYLILSYLINNFITDNFQRFKRSGCHCSGKMSGWFGQWLEKAFLALCLCLHTSITREVQREKSYCCSIYQRCYWCCVPECKYFVFVVWICNNILNNILIYFADNYREYSRGCLGSLGKQEPIRQIRDGSIFGSLFH